MAGPERWRGALPAAGVAVSARLLRPSCCVWCTTHVSPAAKMPKYNTHPKLAAHKLDNLAVVFKFLENAEVSVITKPINVSDVRPCWALFVRVA